MVCFVNVKELRLSYKFGTWQNAPCRVLFGCVSVWLAEKRN